MPEVHVHAPHELSEAGEAESPHERVLELAAVLLLSIATVCIAWSGYQAARWSGEQSEGYARAGTARALANRAATVAAEQRIQDLVTFNRWLELMTAGDETTARLYERQFRKEFRTAFDPWLAKNPLQGEEDISNPLQEDAYRLAATDKAAALEVAGNRRFGAAKEANKHADAYIFGTVFFAAVLFFAGISMRFRWTAMRVAVLVAAGIFLGYGVVQLVSLPRI